MKLGTYESANGPRACVLIGDRVVDAAPLLGEANLRDVQALLELPNNPLERLRAAIGSANGGTSGVPLSEAKLRSPILRPPTIRDFMVFEGHANGGGTRTLNEAWFRLPIFYFSNTLRVFGPSDTVPYPSATKALDYELELGVVISKEASNVKEANFLDCVAGFTILNDWSCRDLQRDESQCGLGPAKGKDSATTLGPWIVTPDEFDIRDGKLFTRCRLRVNGATWQDENAGIMYHSWGAMVERASKDSLMVPGDVLGSGTVTGGSIGEAIRNGVPGARYLKPGDVVEIEVDGIGIQRNTVGQPIDPDQNYRYTAKEGVFAAPTPLEGRKPSFV